MNQYYIHILEYYLISHKQGDNIINKKKSCQILDFTVIVIDVITFL